MSSLRYLITFISIALMTGNSCKKKSSCYSSSAIGRIIGWDPCRNYIDLARINGSGFVIEREQNGIKDTVVTFGLPEGQFTFQSTYFDGSYSSYLFKPGIQDLYKIRFNYEDANASNQTHVICLGNIYTSGFDAAVKGKEIFVSCITNR